MTTAADRILVDPNVLVYAALRNSPWHVQAIQALHAELQAGTEMWVSRQILREYVAVITRPGTTTLATWPMTRMMSPRICCRSSKPLPFGGKQIHDANLVATMQTYGISRLLTHNTADFTRFGSRILVAPIVAEP